MAKVNLGIETSSVINMAAGVVVGVMAYYQTTSYDTAFWAGVIGGAVLLAVGAFTAWQGATERGDKAFWPSGLALLTGLVLVVYPWFLSVSNAYFYTVVIAGALVALVSGYEMWAANRAEAMPPQRPTV